MKLNKLLGFTVFFFLLISCDNFVYDAYKPMAKKGWHKDSMVTFNFTIVDTLAANNLFLHVRNNNAYRFSNLFLITQLQFPDGFSIVDTLQYEMADKTGKYLGVGFTDIKESKLFYKENKKFLKDGNYKLSVQQAMRKSNTVNGIEYLKGITNVGFRIEEIQ